MTARFPARTSSDRSVGSLGKPAAGGIGVVNGYGVASGKPIKRNRDGQIFIQSLRGVCTMPFKNLTGDKYTAPLGGECSTAMLDSSGTELFLTITDGLGQTQDSTDF